jgi:hypothetical protein
MVGNMPLALTKRPGPIHSGRTIGNIVVTKVLDKAATTLMTVAYTPDCRR